MSSQPLHNLNIAYLNTGGGGGGGSFIGLFFSIFI